MRLPLLLLCLTALEAPLAAGGPLPEGWVQAKAAVIKTEGCESCLKDSLGVGAGAGMWFGPRWGAEVDLLHLRLESRHSSAASDETHLMASGLFNLAPSAAPWIPYARAGLGLASIQSPYSLATHRTTRATYHAGLGAQRWWGDRRMFSAEIRSVTIDNVARRTELQGLLGLGLRWGGPASAAPSVAPPAPPAPSPAPVAVPAPPPKPAPAPAPAPKVEQPAAPPPAPAPVPLPRRIVLDEAVLHFLNNRSELDAGAVEAIRQVAATLKAYEGDYKLRVVGHTSSTGNAAHNRALSLRRAKAVADVLAAEGIPASRLQAEGAGPDQPIADNGTAEGRARNRRVEIEVKAQGAEMRRTDTAVRD